MSVLAAPDRGADPAGLVLTLGAALALGAVLAWVDTRPGFDDTGVIAGLVFLASLACVALGRAPIAAVVLLVGGAIPATHVALGHGAASWIALLPAVLGAGAGWFARSMWNRVEPR